MASEGKRGKGRFEFKPARQRSFCNGRVNMVRIAGGGGRGMGGGRYRRDYGRKRGEMEEKGGGR